MQSSIQSSAYQGQSEPRTWLRQSDSQPISLTEVRSLKEKSAKSAPMALLKKLAAVTIDETVDYVKELYALAAAGEQRKSNAMSQKDETFVVDTRMLKQRRGFTKIDLSARN